MLYFTIKILELSLIQFGLILPFLFLKKSFLTEPLKYIRAQFSKIILLFCTLFIQNIFLNAFRGKHIFNLDWNWIGKTLELMIPFGFIFLFNRIPKGSNQKQITISDIGYKNVKNIKECSKITISALILIIAISHFFSSGSSKSNTFNLETFLFQLSMPGLSEEPMYRGLYPLLVAKILKKKSLISLTIPIILFTIGHIIYFNPSQNEILYDLSPFLPITIFGCIITYVREKTKSLYPCILIHNLANTWHFMN